MFGGRLRWTERRTSGGALPQAWKIEFLRLVDAGRTRDAARLLRRRLRRPTAAPDTIVPIADAMARDLTDLHDVEAPNAVTGASAGDTSGIEADSENVPTFRAYLLGPFEVIVGGVRIDHWITLRGQAILRYLLLDRGKPVPRETLMAAMWPEASTASARNCLNVAIHGLRRSLQVNQGDPNWIVYRNGCYHMHHGTSYWTDLDEFRQMANLGMRALDERLGSYARECLERAVALHRGQLYETEPPEDWFLPDFREVEALFLDSLERLAGSYFEAGDMNRCVLLCRQLINEDPCRETAHQLLMQAYAAQKHFHLAARQYADCVQTLKDKLAVRPSPETNTLFRTLAAGRA